MATKEEERERTEGAEDSEAGGELGKRGVVDLATSPAGKTGSPSTTATHGGGELRETSPHTVPCAAHGEARYRGRMVYDKWGPSVRFKFLVKLCILI